MVMYYRKKTPRRLASSMKLRPTLETVANFGIISTVSLVHPFAGVMATVFLQRESKAVEVSALKTAEVFARGPRWRKARKYKEEAVLTQRKRAALWLGLGVGTFAYCAAHIKEFAELL